MRLLVCLLLLIAPAWAQVIEFACEPGDAQIYRVDQGRETLLGMANRPVSFRRDQLPDKLILLYRRPGWLDATVEVKRRDLEHPRYPANGRALCLTPGISLRDRGYQFWFAASTCLPWIAAVVAITTVLSVAQKVVMDRQKRPPQPLGSR